MWFFALNGVAYVVHVILGRVTGLGSEPAFVYRSNRRDIARLWIEEASSDGRDHSTVCHALQRIEMLRHSDPGIDGVLATLTHEIKAALPRHQHLCQEFGNRPASPIQQMLLDDAFLDLLADRILDRIRVRKP
jgi:hypothetical protein